MDIKKRFQNYFFFIWNTKNKYNYNNYCRYKSSNIFKTVHISLVCTIHTARPPPHLSPNYNARWRREELLVLLCRCRLLPSLVRLVLLIPKARICVVVLRAVGPEERCWSGSHQTGTKRNNHSANKQQQLHLGMLIGSALPASGWSPSRWLDSFVEIGVIIDKSNKYSIEF